MSLLPPSPLFDETIVEGQTDHVDDHERIAHILNNLAAFIPGNYAVDVVRDHGADPTGVADCSTAFIAAVADGFAQKKKIIVPPGTYRFTASVPVTVPVTIEGTDEETLAHLIPPSATVPVFAVNHRSSGLIIRNFDVFYGRCAIIRESYGVLLDNVHVNNAADGIAPIQVINSFWITWTRPGIGNSAGTPGIEYIGDIATIPPPIDVSSSYLVRVIAGDAPAAVFSGGGIRIIQSGGNGLAPPEFIFDYLQSENFTSRTPMISIEAGKAFYDAVLTSGSAAVYVPSGDFSGADVGKPVAAPGITPGTTVLTVTDATHITLSATVGMTINGGVFVVDRTIVYGSQTHYSIRNYYEFDSTGGPHPIVRVMASSTHGVKHLVFDNCQVLPRPIEVVQGGQVHTVWLGPILGAPLIQDVNGNALANGSGYTSTELTTEGIRVGNGPQIDDAMATLLALRSLGPSLWLNGDGPFWQDSARTVPATADTNPIGAWDDLSPGARHAVQATAGQRPLLKTNIVNGRQVARFDGVDDFLLSTIDAQTAQTIFIVMKKATSPAAANSSALGMGGTNRFVGVTTGNAQWQYVLNQASGAENFGGTLTNFSIVALTYASLTSATGRVSGGAGTVFDPIDGFQASTSLYLACSQGTVQFTDIDVAEVFRVSRKLSLAEHDLVGKYLARKYGLTWTAAA